LALVRALIINAPLPHPEERAANRAALEVNNMAGPVNKIRAGSVSAALWENEATVNGRTVTMLKATVERRYKDKDGNWKSSGSFSRNEIPFAIYALGKAFQAMIEERGDDDER
jgi:hypothetical protein